MHFWISKIHSEFRIAIIRIKDSFKLIYADILKSAYFMISLNVIMDIQLNLF